MGAELAAGTPGGIRTPDPLVRSQILYPAELLAHITVVLDNDNIISYYFQLVKGFWKIFFVFDKITFSAENVVIIRLCELFSSLFSNIGITGYQNLSTFDIDIFPSQLYNIF